MSTNGIYCIEGLWDSCNIQDRSTVRPILELMEKAGYCDFIYHDAATLQELKFYLTKWMTRSIYKKYPVLYLAFHGDSGLISLPDNVDYTLEELGDFLQGKCPGSVIHFGSCSTLLLDKRLIKSFLVKTGAIAVIGYKTDVDWIQSTACDLFVFEALQNDKLDSKGIEKIYVDIVTKYGNLYKILGLSIVINDRQHFPRRRN
jgi:hypothetical protein